VCDSHSRERGNEPPLLLLVSSTYHVSRLAASVIRRSTANRSHRNHPFAEAAGGFSTAIPDLDTEDALGVPLFPSETLAEIMLATILPRTMVAWNWREEEVEECVMALLITWQRKDQGVC